MSTSMNQNNSNYKIGLNIHLLSFILPNDLIHDSDSVRVSITTIPDERKQNFQIKGKKMYCSNHTFSLNITDKTDRILIVFRKITILSNDPIIASTTIYLKNFITLPIEKITSGSKNSDVKILEIFYPLQKQIREEEKEKENGQSQEENKQMKRKVIGQMEVQLSFTPPHIHINKEKSNKADVKNNNHIEKKTYTNRIYKLMNNGEYEQVPDGN